MVTANGDDVDDLVKTFHALDYNSERPHLIISESTKGRGVSFMENVAKWHHGVPDEEQYRTAIKEIESRIENLKKL